MRSSTHNFRQRCLMAEFIFHCCVLREHMKRKRRAVDNGNWLWVYRKNLAATCLAPDSMYFGWLRIFVSLAFLIILNRPQNVREAKKTNYLITFTWSAQFTFMRIVSSLSEELLSCFQKFIGVVWILVKACCDTQILSIMTLTVKIPTVSKFLCFFDLATGGLVIGWAYTIVLGLVLISLFIALCFGVSVVMDYIDETTILGSWEKIYIKSLKYLSLLICFRSRDGSCGSPISSNCLLRHFSDLSCGCEECKKSVDFN